VRKRDCAGAGVQLEVVTAKADTAAFAKSGFFVVLLELTPNSRPEWLTTVPV